MMRYIVKHDPNAIAVYDRDLRYIAVSDRYLQDYNVGEENVLGRQHYEVFPEMPQRWKDVHQRVLAGAIERNDDDWFERPDGSITYNRWECRPWYQADGSIGGMITYTEVTTQRKLAEQALRASELKYRALIELSDDGTFILDPHGRFLLVNPALCSMLGYDEEELLGLNTLDTYATDEEERQQGRARLEELRTGVGMHFERRMMRKDGSLLLVEVSAQRLPDGRIQATVRDITDRRRAEDALREAETHYRLLFEHSPDGVVLLDPDDLSLLEFNALAHTQLGYTREEFARLRLEDIEAVEKLEDITARVARLTREGRDEFDTKHRTRQGDIRDVHVITQYTETLGRPVCHCIWRDVTEQRKAQRDYQTLFREMLNGFVLCDIVSDDAGTPIDYRFVTVNPAFERMTDLRAEDIVGRTLREVWPEAEADWMEDYGRVAATREPALLQQSSRELGKHFEVAVFCPAHGQIAGIFTDVTERVEAERERARLQDQLQQAQKMESVGRLAGGVAHDFNNMLGVILGYTEMALSQVDSDQPLHSDLEEVQRAALRSADLTRQLLAFARKSTVSPRVLDLNETVEKALKMLERLIGENVSLRWQAGANLWPVRVDPVQIDQILANLCINARDAIVGVGTIAIQTRNVMVGERTCAALPDCVPGEYVALTVSDTGRGMDPETLSHLFEPFFTTKEVGQGTGLGLATVYGIVRQNGGFIDVRSAPGRGSTFVIYLQPHREGAGRVRGETGQTRPDRGAETILVVEDEPAILGVARRMLENMGYRVLAAGSPREAISLADAHVGEIDLLMTDVIMPEMDGRLLARRLLSQYPDMGRLFVSGYTADVIAHGGVLEEGVCFLQKPFSLKELSVKVREALDARPSASAVTPPRAGA